MAQARKRFLSPCSESPITSISSPCVEHSFIPPAHFQQTIPSQGVSSSTNEETNSSEKTTFSSTNQLLVDPLAQLAYFTMYQDQRESTDLPSSESVSPEMATLNLHESWLERIQLCQRYDDVRKLMNSAMVLLRRIEENKRKAANETNLEIICILFDKLTKLAVIEFKDLYIINGKKKSHTSSKLYQLAGVSATSFHLTHPSYDTSICNSDTYIMRYRDYISLYKEIKGKISLCFLEKRRNFTPASLMMFLRAVSAGGLNGNGESGEIGLCRDIAEEIQRRQCWSTFTPHNYIHILAAYTKALENETYGKGGIEETSIDTHFINMLLSNLTKQYDSRNVDYAYQKDASDDTVLSNSPKNTNEKKKDNFTDQKKSYIEYLSPHEITVLLRCCQRLSKENTTLMSKTGIYVLKNRRRFNQKQWSTIVSAFTLFGVPLKGECIRQKRNGVGRDWARPPPPKQPKPMSLC